MDVNEPQAAPGYRRGDRIALVSTDDPYTRLRPGDEGTVAGWDPAHGQLLVDWDSGSSLIMLPGEGDRVRLIGRAAVPHAETCTGAGADNGVVMVLRGHLGDFLLTSRPVAGLVDCQGVKLIDVAVTGGGDVMVTVEGQQSVLGDLAGPVRKTVGVGDLVVPDEWRL
jgi:hypothetical protein